MTVHMQCQSPVSLNTLFPAEVHVCNRTAQARDMILRIPTSSSSGLKSHMPSEDRLEKATTNKEMDPLIVCLEASDHLGSLQPQQSITKILHFLPLKEGLLLIDSLELVDAQTGEVFKMQSPCEIAVARNAN